jgi:SAM-dependent methyltransferase
MDERAARERRYWDEAYRAEGLDHEKYLWSKAVAASSYGDDLFGGLLANLSHKRVLTIGGGVDTVGVMLAKNDNRVVSADISPVAAQQTRLLARRSGVEKNLSAVVMNCEEVGFEDTFDAVVCKRALHHMNLAKVLEGVHRSLIAGGRFFAEEPVCLLRPLRRIHEKFPFHPDAPRTADEVEFAPEDLAFIKSVFGETEFHYIDFLTRESVKHFVWKARAGRWLRPLGRLDFALLNRYLTPLKYLSTYVIIRAVK